MISIIVPVYNSEAYLVECVDSILAQTYKDFELVLLDDGSTDSSPKICEDYMASDSRIRVIHQENSGVAATRNRCISEAKGDWLLFVDSDDILNENMLAHLVEVRERTGADIVSCDFASFVDGELPPNINCADGSEITFSPREAVMDMFSSTGIGWNTWCKLYHKDTFKNVSFPDVVYGEDKGTIYKVYLNATKIVCTDRKLYYYRLRNNSLTSNRSKKGYMNTLLINEEICDFFRFKDEVLYSYACCYAAKNSFLYYTSVEKNQEMQDVRAVCVAQMRKYYQYMPSCKFLPLHQRLIVWLAGWSVRNKDTGLGIHICAEILRVVKSTR